MQKWNYKTSEYEEYTVPDDWKVKTFSIDMDEKVNCAACGKSIGLMFEPSIEGCSRVLGDYKTQEKAMSVLDELQFRIARSESGVYQMPKDEI